ncbi:Similar to APLF: Aprataxin and PNK-like factor (Homo sapiens) [Cotesia congregata]|uniref:Similar to APLF: Aprataxin and PNK-like factor (Homo sapiens) n=1 Tax=Cotesia congregata TaxID=51543 RepID=A0A8J2HT13_COTCN|nr:Similar to APLF: Aprataxin and PNK-like factor (Homo sapiens) [Cotesia congregata]
MDKKNSDGKRKSRSSNEGPPDKKSRIDIEDILLPCEDRNNDLSSHSIQNVVESSNSSKVELIKSSNDPSTSKEIHQSTSVEEATGIRVPAVNTEDKLIECTILVDTVEKKIKWNDKKNSTSKDASGDSVKNSQTPQTSTKTPAAPRAKCTFGAKCFRLNSEHKVKYSHPGDADFDVKDNRPECRHGIHCYRKNSQHKKDYQHTLVRRKRKVNANQVQVLKKGKDDDSDRDSDDSSFEESVDESEYGPSDLDESSEEENDVEDDDSDW